MNIDWAKEIGAAITMCDTDFKITYMNDKSQEEFGKYGGKDLLGENLLDCHNAKSGKLMRDLLDNDKSHSYTRVTKSGKQKAILQAPFKEKGVIKGLVEISFYVI